MGRWEQGVLRPAACGVGLDRVPRRVGGGWVRTGQVLAKGIRRRRRRHRCRVVAIVGLIVVRVVVPNNSHHQSSSNDHDDDNNNTLNSNNNRNTPPTKTTATATAAARAAATCLVRRHLGVADLLADKACGTDRRDVGRGRGPRRVQLGEDLVELVRVCMCLHVETKRSACGLEALVCMHACRAVSLPASQP